MRDKPPAAPDSTAARVALWRALHVQADPPPHVLEDEIGLRLVAPDADWRDRPDMNPQFTSPFRVLPSWPARASSRTLSRSRRAAAFAST
jgi:hypothetical protein